MREELDEQTDPIAANIAQLSEREREREALIQIEIYFT